jgi:hypothetical protein
VLAGEGRRDEGEIGGKEEERRKERWMDGWMDGGAETARAKKLRKQKC